MQVCYGSHSSFRARLVDKNTYSQCDWLRQTCYYSACLTDGNAISKSVFMIRIYDEPLMTYLYFAAFYMTVTPLLASARKPPRYLWSYGISLTAVCQSSAAYESSMWMNLSSTRNGSMVKHLVFNISNMLIIKAQQQQSERWGVDGHLLNQNIEAITAIFSAGTPQIYSLFCFSPPCLSSQLRLNHNPPISPPPFLPLSLSHRPSFSLRFCIPTWSMCNELARLRQTLYPRVFTGRDREGEREREGETQTIMSHGQE